MEISVYEHDIVQLLLVQKCFTFHTQFHRLLSGIRKYINWFPIFHRVWWWRNRDKPNGSCEHGNVTGRLFPMLASSVTGQ